MKAMDPREWLPLSKVPAADVLRFVDQLHGALHRAHAVQVTACYERC